MKSLEIFRIENPETNEGMYSTAYMELPFWFHEQTHCPGPHREQEEPKLSKFWEYLEHHGESWDWYFGFRTLKQAAKWISPDRWHIPEEKWFKKANRKVVVSKYAVDCEDNIFHGNSQSIFVRERAGIVDTTPLIKLQDLI